MGNSAFWQLSTFHRLQKITNAGATSLWTDPMPQTKNRLEIRRKSTIKRAYTDGPLLALWPFWVQTNCPLIVVLLYSTTFVAEKRLCKNSSTVNRFINPIEWNNSDCWQLRANQTRQLRLPPPPPPPPLSAGNPVNRRKDVHGNKGSACGSLMLDICSNSAGSRLTTFQANATRQLGFLGA